MIRNVKRVNTAGTKETTAHRIRQHDFGDLNENLVKSTVHDKERRRDR